MRYINYIGLGAGALFLANVCLEQVGLSSLALSSVAYAKDGKGGGNGNGGGGGNGKGGGHSNSGGGKSGSGGQGGKSGSGGQGSKSSHWWLGQGIAGKERRQQFLRPLKR